MYLDNNTSAEDNYVAFKLFNIVSYFSPEYHIEFTEFSPQQKVVAVKTLQSPEFEVFNKNIITIINNQLLKEGGKGLNDD